MYITARMKLQVSCKRERNNFKKGLEGVISIKAEMNNDVLKSIVKLKEPLK